MGSPIYIQIITDLLSGNCIGWNVSIMEEGSECAVDIPLLPYL